MKILDIPFYNRTQNGRNPDYNNVVGYITLSVKNRDVIFDLFCPNPLSSGEIIDTILNGHHFFVNDHMRNSEIATEALEFFDSITNSVLQNKYYIDRDSFVKFNDNFNYIGALLNSNKNKMRFETTSMSDKNIDKIAEIFPSVITETVDEKKGGFRRAINFDMLRQLLSEDVAEGDEAYEFTWVGKKAAIAEANKPIRKTLRPCPEESVNWDTTENLYIEGDNLEVLKLLQESYLGKVKMIYIDPPYNTGNDFIYRDDFKMSAEEYSEEIGEFDEDDNRLFRNTDSNGRFHSDWCSMIYSRLMLARNLLSDDGVIFISIDDNEQENLKKICDEVFGESNFVSTLGWQKVYSPKNQARNFSNDYEFVLCYSKSLDKLTIGFLPRTKEMNARYKNPDNDPRGDWKPGDCVGNGERKNGYYDVVSPTTGKVFNVPKGKHWVYSPETMERLLSEDRIYFGRDGNAFPSVKQFLSDVGGRKASSLLTFEDYGHTDMAKKEIQNIFCEFEKAPFDTPKPIKLIKMFSIMCTEKDSIILDFFSGSSTTAHAVMQLNAEDGGNRKFIMVQLPEETDEDSEAYKAGYKNICEIGKERIRRAGEKIKNTTKELTITHKITPDKSTENLNDSSDFHIQKTLFDNYKGETGLEIKDLHPETVDVGFRVLKLADSNMTDVYYSPAEYDQSMLDDLESNIKSDRTSLDLLFGCLLEWGLPLSMPYSSEEIEGVIVHTYNDGDLVACFDENISENAVKIIAKRKPLRAVFRDSSFADSPSKINVFEIFKLYAPDTRVKVI